LLFSGRPEPGNWRAFFWPELPKWL
jgi:hypothetical protein